MTNQTGRARSTAPSSRATSGAKKTEMASKNAQVPPMRAAEYAIISRRKATSGQARLPPKVTECPDMGEGEREADLVLVGADGAEGEAAVFHAHADAIPVVAELGGAVLQVRQIGIEADAPGQREAVLIGMA